MHRGERVAKLVHSGREGVLPRAESPTEALDVAAELGCGELQRVSLGKERETVTRRAGDGLERSEARAQHVRGTERGEDASFGEVHERDRRIRTQGLCGEGRGGRADDRR